MSDIVSKAKRSEVMAAVRSTGNRATELRMIALFRANGIIGWRRDQGVIGKPDFVFGSERVAVFVDGCFWHGCPKCYRRPRSHQKYWDSKVAGNIARDRCNRSRLRRMGWWVVRIWEHELKLQPSGCTARILRALRKGTFRAHEKQMREQARGDPSTRSG